MDKQSWKPRVGMKPLSERDENFPLTLIFHLTVHPCRNEATL